MRQMDVHGTRHLAARTFLVIVALGATGTVATLARTSEARATTLVACRTSQIQVTAGPTLTNVRYSYKASGHTLKGLAQQAVPVYFYDKGATCHLLMSGPDIRMVRNATDASSIAASDLSAPTGNPAVSERAVVDRHQRIEALVSVNRLPKKDSKNCVPATSTGFLVGDYANPVATSHFIVRALDHVCFDPGTVGGPVTINFGVSWSMPQ